MCRDQRVDSAAELAKPPMRACLILSHPAAETDHIRLQNGGKFPLPSARFEDLGHRPSDDQQKIGATHTADAFDPTMCNAHYTVLRQRDETAREAVLAGRRGQCRSGIHHD
jgi:hypothetical protein